MDACGTHVGTLANELADKFNMRSAKRARKLQRPQLIGVGLLEVAKHSNCCDGLLLRHRTTADGCAAGHFYCESTIRAHTVCSLYEKLLTTFSHEKRETTKCKRRNFNEKRKEVLSSCSIPAR